MAKNMDEHETEPDDVGCVQLASGKLRTPKTHTKREALSCSGLHRDYWDQSLHSFRTKG